MSEGTEFDEITLKKRINTISKNAQATSITNARSDFNDFLKSFIQTAKKTDTDPSSYSEPNPSSIDELIQSYTDRFDRLKFLFLEQEAKEQFFKLVLEPDSKVIDREEILKAVQKGEDLKKQLQDKKDEIDLLTSDILEKSKSSYGYYEDVSFKTQNLLILLDEIVEKNKYLDELYEGLTNFNSQDPTLKEFEDLKSNNKEIDFNLEDLKNDELVEKLNEIKSKRKLAQDKIESLEEEKRLKINKLERDEQRSNELMEQEKKLDKLVNDINEAKSVVNEDEHSKQETLEIEERENKVLALIEILKKLTNLSTFHYNPDQNLIFFKFKNNETNECQIQIDADRKIEKIVFPLINQDKLNEIMKDSNKFKNPLQEATNSLHKTIQ